MESELPKKKELPSNEDMDYDDSCNYYNILGFNQCLDLIKPIHDKQALGIKALKAELEKLKQIIIEDVPHKYQERLLEVFNEK